MLADLRGGILSELSSTTGVKVDVYRRNLQRAFVDLLIARLNPPAAPATATAAIKDDSRGAIRAELRTILDLLNVVAGADTATKTHIADLKAQIELAFEPKK